jgi:hypothetical protein
MNPDIFKAWLKKRNTLGFAQNLLAGGLTLLFGILVLTFTFWVAYGVIWFVITGLGDLSAMIAGKRLHLSHTPRLVFAGIFIVLLFIQHFRTRPGDFGEYGKLEYWDGHTLRPLKAPTSLYFGHVRVAGMLLGNPGITVNMFADVLLIGPRLVAAAPAFIAQGFRLRSMDANACGDLLACLYSRPHAVPFEELTAAGWEGWFDQVRCIDGVQFLQKGVTLSSDLRSELDELCGHKSPQVRPA